MKKELYIKPETQAHKVQVTTEVLKLSSNIGVAEASETEGPEVVDLSPAELEAWGDANFRHDGFKDDTKIW